MELPFDSDRVARLCGAIQRSRLMLREPREQRREMVRQFVGSHYSEDGTEETVPVNLISLYVEIMGARLIAKNPRVMLSTFDRGMKPTINAMQAWANKEIERMELASILQRVVVDAFYSVGIAKVALADPSNASMSGWGLMAGEPFVSLVDLDDFVYDMRCRDFKQASFLGHRYRVPLETVRDSKLYSKARKDLIPAEDRTYNQEGDERIDVIGKGLYGTNSEDWEDYVDLWEIYLPRHRLILTLADNQITGAEAPQSNGRVEPLRVQPWIGPYCGPYHILGYQTVPGNPLPKGPIQDLLDLHLEMNIAWRKIFRTMRRIKEVGFVRGAASEDGNRIIKADDGDFIRVDDPQGIKVAALSGTTIQTLIPVAAGAYDLFSRVSGNIEAIGGLGTQSKTLGQDRMLNESASTTVEDKAKRTVNYVSDVIKALCWYWYNDPVKVQKSKHALPGLPNLQIERAVTPEMRKKGRFEDLDISVDPYSMQHQTPQSRMAALNSVMQGIVMPLMPLLQQQGVSTDINAYLEKVAKFMDMPDLMDVVTIQEPQAPETTSAPPAPGKPPTTERTYNRVNTPSEPGGMAQMAMMSKPSSNGSQNN